MKVVIPTYGRSHKQTTFHELPKEVQERTTLIVDAREEGMYPSYPHLVLPAEIQGICPTRKWCLDNLEDEDHKQLQLDDDLVFAFRRVYEPTKFQPATKADIKMLFDEADSLLDRYAHIGVSTREGGNRRPEPYTYVGRVLRILGYRQDVLRKTGAGSTTLGSVMEDFDLTLQLLRLGYPNASINWIVHNQGGSNTDGGCSSYRSMELQGQAAEDLAEKHHPFVKVVTKTTKTAWGGQTRKDVIVQWKKAYNEGLSKYGEQKP